MLRSIVPFVYLLSALTSGPLAQAVGADWSVSPNAMALDGPMAQAQIVVGDAEGPDANDLTRESQYQSSNPDVATVDQRGRVFAVGDGEAIVTVAHEDKVQEVAVIVEGTQTPVDFVRHIRPILNKTGCASAACHASQYGKGGFKLSVFGFDPDADYEAIARDSRQRRLNFASPDQSLVLRKPGMRMPHGGGRRLDPDSISYATFRQWIAEGAEPSDELLEAVSISVYPPQVEASVGQKQQLQVLATYDNGLQHDVTALCLYDSMDDGVLSVDENGIVQVVGQGQAAVMIRFEGQTAVSMFVSPFAEEVKLDGWQNQNRLDELAEAKFRELGLEPSPRCDDATFIRRVYFDAIGGPPSPEEVREFLLDSRPDKREQLVDRLLGLTGDPSLDIYNDRYAAYWTLKWSDLIRNNSNSVGEQGMWSLHNWIRESFRVNKPFNEFVRELVTAKGSIYSNGPANYFRIHRDSTALTEATAQLFLGVRLECAKCHHHPFESYSQADYYGLAAFFSRVTTKNSEEFGIFGRETVVMVRSSGEVSHPRTRQRMTPTPLGGDPLDAEPLDRRQPLADWLTSPDNDLFARSIVNRYMGYLMGRGLVEPIDDMRSTNPPSNPAMLDYLAGEFRESGYDLKHVMRIVMTSRLYQLSSQPTESNKLDRRFYSHYKVKRIPAEPLLDAVDNATGVQTKFQSLPLGTRAIELPDAEYPNYFLTTFAKPRRASVCECERSPDENLAQALHTLNGDTISSKLSNKEGRIQQLLNQKTPHDQIVDELYVATLSRPPSEAELAFSRTLLDESASPQQCYEDLLWALINSKQFLFVR